MLLSAALFWTSSPTVPLAKKRVICVLMDGSHWPPSEIMHQLYFSHTTTSVNVRTSFTVFVCKFLSDWTIQTAGTLEKRCYVVVSVE